MKKVLKYLVLSFLFVAGNVYASPANDMFIDDNLYKCVVDNYNVEKGTSYKYTDVIYQADLNSLTKLDCSKYSGSIDNLTGLNKLIGLTSLNLSGNTFIGGSLTLNKSNASLKSNLNLPSQIKLSNVTYTMSTPNIVSIKNGIVTPLNIGSTKVTMIANTNGGSVKEEYLVTVSSLNRSNNNKLASLYLSQGEFKFDSDTLSYSTIVDNSINKVTVTAKVLDPKAKFVTNYGAREVTLKEGSNNIEIKVMAENGDVKTYTILVMRSNGNDTNNRLINIELSTGNINFSPDVYIYSFTVASNVDELVVKGVSESPLSKVEVSDTKLRVGENKITITVTSESHDKKEYQLIVTREDYDSLDNYLSALNIEGYSVNFNRNTFSYNLKINNEKTLKIVPVVEKNDATYTITGNTNLKNNSVIKIYVSDKEGSTRTYVLNISKDEPKISIDYRLVIVFSEFLIIFILVIILISKNNKNRPKRVRKVRPVNMPKKAKVKVTNNVCKNCGTVNDIGSTKCYICGNNL